MAQTLPKIAHILLKSPYSRHTFSDKAHNSSDKAYNFSDKAHNFSNKSPHSLSLWNKGFNNWRSPSLRRVTSSCL